MTRYVLDPATRRIDGGGVLIGGSPLLVLRLGEAGAALVDHIEAGDDLDEVLGALAGGARSVHRLLDRMIDNCMCHPMPVAGSGPFRARDVTVVVPVHDGPQALAATLTALARTAPDVAAVVVVDDASTDPESHGRIVDRFQRVCFVRRSRNGGPAAARNTGLAQVATPVTAFVDAGAVPQAGWLDTSLAHFADERVAAVAGRIVAAHGGGAVIAYESNRSSLDLGPTPAPVRPRSRVPYVPAVALIARTETIRAAGGFDEALRFGEDVDLVWRFHDEGHRVRYEPSARIGHDHPNRLASLLARRFDYGTSAAPLARRHPGTLAPLGVSGWSAALWALVAAGHPLAGGGVAVGTAIALARKLRALDHPMAEAFRLAGIGHLAAGRLLASTLLRAWWPVAVALALVSRRARRVVLVAAVVPALLEWRERRPDLDPMRWIALSIADDTAYAAGVWVGCVDERIAEPLVPMFREWPGKRDRS